MTFRVGQRVVCVDDKNSPGKVWWGPHPIRGRVYTVDGFETIRGDNCIIIRSLDPYWAFRADRFRPVVERKTDISIFTKMLNTERVDA